MFFDILFDKNLIRDLIVVVVVLTLSILSSKANVDSIEIKKLGKYYWNFEKFFLSKACGEVPLQL